MPGAKYVIYNMPLSLKSLEGGFLQPHKGGDLERGMESPLWAEESSYCKNSLSSLAGKTEKNGGSEDLQSISTSPWRQHPERCRPTPGFAKRSGCDLPPPPLRTPRHCRTEPAMSGNWELEERAVPSTHQLGQKVQESSISWKTTLYLAVIPVNETTSESQPRAKQQSFLSAQLLYSLFHSACLARAHSCRKVVIMFMPTQLWRNLCYKTVSGFIVHYSVKLFSHCEDFSFEDRILYMYFCGMLSKRGTQ